MWKTFRCLAAFCLLAAAGQTQAASYICQVNGKAVFSSEKLNAGCQLSVMNGISGEADGEAAASAAGDYDAVSRVVEKEMFGAYDDVKILPRTEPKVAAAPEPKVEVHLRKGQTAAKTSTAKRGGTARAPVRPAPVVAAPAPKPQLSRRQILQREISNERAALNSAKARLDTAKKSGGNTASLQQTVRDREANLRALQRELGS